MRHINGLKCLFFKGQVAAVQHMQTRLSSLEAETATAMSTLAVFQQAASLASTQDCEAFSEWECAAISAKLVSLASEVEDLKIQIEQSISNHRSEFCQQVLAAI